MFLRLPALHDAEHGAAAGRAGAPARGVGIASARTGGRRRRATRALGLAIAPTTETRVIARGTHRTRVSEKRRSAAPGRASRPDLSDATPPGRHVAAERTGEGGVHQGTG